MRAVQLSSSRPGERSERLSRPTRAGRAVALALALLLAVGGLAACGGGSKKKSGFKPSADANPFGGPVPLKVRFTSSAGSIPGPIAYHWCFDDGTTSEEQNPTHVFPRAGYYLVSVDIEGRKLTQRATRSLYLGAWPPKLWTAAQHGFRPARLRQNITAEQRRTQQRKRELRNQERRTGKKSQGTLHPCGRLEKFGP
jgi:hypothetical protein